MSASGSDIAQKSEGASQVGAASDNTPAAFDMDTAVAALDRFDAAVSHDPFDRSFELNPRHGPTNYGFDGKYNRLVGQSVEAGNKINEIRLPEEFEEFVRIDVDEDVSKEFDPVRYLLDKYENPRVAELVSWKPPAPGPPSDAGRDQLAWLAPRNYKGDNAPAQLRRTYLGLPQLLFAYAYDRRLNLGEASEKSAWTIGKLTPMFAALYDNTEEINNAVISGTRRALTFAPVRSWDLALAAWRDVVATLQAGRTAVLGVLAALLVVFEEEPVRVYRTIWIEDYALWIQGASDTAVAALADVVNVTINGFFEKKDLYLRIPELEEAAEEARREGKPLRDVPEGLGC